MKRNNIEHSTLSKRESSNMGAVFEKMESLKDEQPEEIKSESVIPAFKDLILLGKIFEVVEIGSYKFQISTLSNKQRKSVMDRITKLPPQDQVINIKPYTLAESIISVNDLDLVQISNLDKGSDFEKKLDVIAEWQAILVDKLFERYESMIASSKKFFEGATLEEETKKS